MKRRLLILPVLLLASAVLSGCAPLTPAMVRGVGLDRQYAFDAAEGYRPVYRKILEQAQKCFFTYKITAQMVAFGELREDAPSGTVTVSFDGILATDTYQVIDIFGISDDASLVIAYYSLDPAAVYGPLLKEWVLDNSTECVAQTKADGK